MWISECVVKQSLTKTNKKYPRCVLNVYYVMDFFQYTNTYFWGGCCFFIQVFDSVKQCTRPLNVQQLKVRFWQLVHVSCNVTVLLSSWRKLWWGLQIWPNHIVIVQPESVFLLFIITFFSFLVIIYQYWCFHLVLSQYHTAVWLSMEACFGKNLIQCLLGYRGVNTLYCNVFF